MVSVSLGVVGWKVAGRRSTMPNAQAKVKPIKEIKQAELSIYLYNKGIVDALKRRLDEATKELEGLGEAILVKVEGGWLQEQGHLIASINVTERRNVQWKAVVFRRLGEQIIKDETEACQPTQYKKVVVLPRVEGK
jgi:hypothetical protein